MAHTAERAVRRARGRLVAIAAIGTRASGRRHPLVAAAMVLPLAIVLAIAFGAVQAVITQASSVAGMLGH
ncbi:hypothetical protein DB35_21240 [Streptomyces abyssalis]|uniref:Uncharacterized protein n=1 Tax=Streptomyces abyssalis TaxID=933944 RepID=A0A1E7JUD9_9ACTN|nr:hypothetical protein [Streptomyces abyssalis]OEU88774.1 hypothetical protein DB35_21240 [Streptomyces abyssalis]OEU93565.1 hypothetical protein AN215_01880 [Streptomyces abyssalis]OEV07795.1 hypothetical protein AN219_31730 [Streptomyces nanshensis]